VYHGSNDKPHDAAHGREYVLLYQGINKRAQLDEGAKP
jgi:hypothetical protein